MDLQTVNGVEINQLDPVVSLACEQMRSDAKNTCKILSISQGKLSNDFSLAYNSLLLYSYYGRAVSCKSIRGQSNLDSLLLNESISIHNNNFHVKKKVHYINPS